MENKVQLASLLPWPDITQRVNGDGMTCPLNAYINLKFCILAQHWRLTLNQQQKIYIYNISSEKQTKKNTTKPFKHSDFRSFIYGAVIFFNHQVILY